jgi:hypothetical protein
MALKNGTGLRAGSPFSDARHDSSRAYEWELSKVTDVGQIGRIFDR